MHSMHRKDVEALAELGWEVFPCTPNGKTPITRKGFYDATKGEELKKFFPEGSVSNVGVRIPDGVVVLDYDYDVDHFDVFDTLGSTNMVVRTRRGYHFYYKCPQGSVKPTVGRTYLKMRFDVRAVGSYVLAPESVVNGVKYTYISGPVAPSDLPSIDISKILVTSASDQVRTKSTLPELDSSLWVIEAVRGNIPKGRRQTTLFRLACRHRSLGLSKTESSAILWNSAKTCGILDENPFVVEEIIERVWKRYDGPPEEEGKVFSAKSLLLSQNSPRFILDEIIPENSLVLLYGAPKVGKSSLVYYIVGLISMGIPVWGRKTTKKKVLYLDLEQSPQFAAERIKKQFSENLEDLDMDLAFSFKNFKRGGLKVIEEKVNEGYGVVVIDTLAAFSAHKEGGNLYYNEYEIMSSFRSICKSSGITMIVVHHTNKQKLVSGSTALTGSADVIMEVRRMESRGWLYVDGKNVKRDRYVLGVDMNLGKWEIEKL